MHKDNIVQETEEMNLGKMIVSQFIKCKSIVKTEAKAILREPSSIFFIFVLPLVLTIVFGSAFGQDVMDAEKGFKGIDTVFPINIVFIIANIGLMGIPISISELKEKGTLKRYFSYPISYMMYFFSVMVTYIVVNLISSILVSLTCFLFFDAHFYMTFIQGVSFVLFWLLSIYIFYGLGYVMVLLFKSSRSTNIASTAIFLVMIFGSGIAIPLNSLPSLIKKVAEFTPMAHSIKVLEGLWLGKQVFQENIMSVFYLAGISILLTVVIYKYKIKWEA
ncbi:ABC transporter permease [Listeria aquatica]|uniref:ABC transporter permease n=1 Tax=Listeria aquatica TaxID=1494960 RepID=UPI003EF8C649